MCLCFFRKKKLFPTVFECHDKWDLIACYHALYLICALSSGHQSASIRSRQNGTQLSIGLCLKYRFQPAPVRFKTTDDKNDEVSAARAISKYVGVLLIVKIVRWHIIWQHVTITQGRLSVQSNVRKLSGFWSPLTYKWHFVSVFYIKKSSNNLMEKQLTLKCRF